METRCQKCDTPAASDQAFCSRCGAVLGMADDEGGSAPELAATMVGKKLPTAPPAPRPATRPPAGSRTPAPPTMAPATNARGERVLILVAVGIVLVLLVATALVLFFLLGRG